MKAARQNKILEIIGSGDIETQNQLMEALAACGIRSTQATLSRDIKELRLVKELAPSGRYRYAAAREEVPNNDERLMKIFRECVVSYTSAQNIVVLKTLPGMANAACSALDSMSIPDLVGTLAGDDTAFLLMKDTPAAEDFCREIKALL